MENIKIKGKEYLIEKTYDDGSMQLTYKGKKYVCLAFEPKSKEFFETVYALKRIKAAGVRIPKLILADKKSGYVLREMVEGTPIIELVSNGQVNEEIYKKIFGCAFLCKLSRISLDYSPNLWLLIKDQLVYIGTSFFNYCEKNDFANNGVRLWFFTRDFVNFAKKFGYELSNIPLKDEYSLNKEIVLIACKYYR